MTPAQVADVVRYHSGSHKCVVDDDYWYADNTEPCPVMRAVIDLLSSYSLGGTP